MVKIWLSKVWKDFHFYVWLYGFGFHSRGEWSKRDLQKELLTKLAEADPHGTDCFAPEWQEINYKGKQCRGALLMWTLCLESHTIAGSATSTKHEHTQTHTPINSLKMHKKWQPIGKWWKKERRMHTPKTMAKGQNEELLRNWGCNFFFGLILGKQLGRLLQWRGRMVNQSSTAEKFIKKQLEWLNALLLSSVRQGQMCLYAHAHTNTQGHTHGACYERLKEPLSWSKNTCGRHLSVWH